MSVRVLEKVGLAVVFPISITAWFLLATILTGLVPDATLVAAGGLACLAFTLVAGVPKRALLAEASHSELALAAAAGILMVVVAPMLVLANRYSDAPPGTEVLFFTTAAWGVLSLGAGIVGQKTSWRPGYAALSAAALLGAATLLANWERPSSFSPLVRYPRQEVAFLIAGLAWAIGSVLLIRARRTLGPAVTRFTAGLAGGAVAVGYALVTQGLDGLFGADAVSAVAAGVGFAVALVSWWALVASVGTPRASFMWFLPPVLMTALGVVEQAVRPRGPDPVVWAGAWGGIILITGATVLAWALTPEEAPARSRARAAAAVLLASVVAALAAVGTLALPAIQATVRGTVDSGEPYRASWALLGFETGGGWLPVVVAALVLAGAWLAYRGAPRAWVVGLGAAGLAAAALYPLLASTPLHTWNTWLPNNLQSEFGTEYVSLSFATVHHPLRLAALGLGVAAAAFLLLTEVRKRSYSQEPGSSEVL